MLRARPHAATVPHRYWHAPSPRMRLRETLYRHLGVKDAATASSYVALLKSIATKACIGEIDQDVHRRCLAWLATALEREDQDALADLRALGDEPVLLNLLGATIWADEAAWLDSQILVEPFAGALDERLVAPPAVSRIAATRLYRELGIARLSEIASRVLAEVPDGVPASEATERLQIGHQCACRLPWFWLASIEEDGARRAVGRASSRHWPWRGPHGEPAISIDGVIARMM